MKTQLIGKSSLLSTRLAYGCWRIVGTWEPNEVTPQRIEQGQRAIIAAYEAGYTLFDHADIYCSGICETVFGEVLKQIGGMRNRILIATKCGIRFSGQPDPSAPYRYDFSRQHILSSCEQSLKRLGIETIDLYQLHRPDYLMDPCEVAEAFDQLRKAGKVREFGVSNFNPSQFSTLQKHLAMPLIVNQVQISLGDLHCFEDGTLDQCVADGITPMAWSPLAGGYLGTGATVDPKHPRRDALLKLLALMDRLAAKYSTTRTNIALAWLLKHPSHIVPIIGSAQPDRIREATRADSIDLTREDWYALLEAARAQRLP